MEPIQNELILVITGAAGQIAYALYNMICASNLFGENTKLHLRLLDIPQALDILHGLCLEIEDCAYKNVKSVRFGSDPTQMFQSADVCIFLGGFPRKQGMQRRDLMKINNGIFKEQGQILDKVAKKTCKSLVVANPCNTNCLTLIKNCPSIPKANFTCLTRLDHNRSLQQLAMKANVPVQEIKNVVIWGNHSNTQYPDCHFVKIKDKPIADYIPDEDFLNKDFIQTIQNRGQEIINVRKSPSVMSAAKAIIDHLKDWIYGTKEGEFTSMGVYTNGQDYSIQKDLVFSLPVVCKNFDWKIVTNLELSSTQKANIEKSMLELIEEREESATI